MLALFELIFSGRDMQPVSMSNADSAIRLVAIDRIGTAPRKRSAFVEVAS
jgi:hypothetical protein